MNKKLILIAVLTLLLAFSLSACGGSTDTETNTETETETDTEAETDTETDTETETETDTNTETDTSVDTSSNEIEYSVKVVNYKGEPISSGLFIQILKGGEELGSMKKSNKDGIATFSLEKGDYTFEIIYTATDSDTITYDAEECVLSAKKPSKEIMLYNVANEGSMLIYPYDTDEGERYEYSAKFVSEGANKVEIDGISYYVFRPTRGGVYRFSYICDVAITFGYYGGSPHYVYENGDTELVDRAFEMEIKESSVGGAVVILGVKSKATNSCFIAIERIRDEEKPIEHIEYTATEVPSSICKYNYLNADLVDLDITSENLTIVYNEEDGYYHLNTADGPIVLVKISVPSRFLTSFTEICDLTKLLKIEYDASGKPIRMEVYNELISKYAKKCDKAGVVPLNKELEYVIKNVMEQQGWYDEQNIFKFPDTTDENNNIIEGEKIYVPEENAWLFPCCYMVENNKGTEETKISVNDTIDPESYLVKIDAGETLYFKASKDRKATLTIINAQQIKVKVNGVDTEYTADENGKIEILLESIPYVYEDEETGEMTEGVYPIEFSITNEGEEMVDLEFTYVTKL